MQGKLRENHILCSMFLLSLWSTAKVYAKRDGVDDSMKYHNESITVSKPLTAVILKLSVRKRLLTVSLA